MLNHVSLACRAHWPVAGRRVERRALHQRSAAEVVAGREARSGAADDRDPHVGVVVVGAQRVEQLDAQRRGDRVALLRPVERDAPDVLGRRVDEDRLVVERHGRSPPSDRVAGAGAGRPAARAPRAASVRDDHAGRAVGRGLASSQRARMRSRCRASAVCSRYSSGTAAIASCFLPGQPQLLDAAPLLGEAAPCHRLAVVVVRAAAHAADVHRRERPHRVERRLHVVGDVDTEQPVKTSNSSRAELAGASAKPVRARRRIRADAVGPRAPSAASRRTAPRHSSVFAGPAGRRARARSARRDAGSTSVPCPDRSHPGPV